MSRRSEQTRLEIAAGIDEYWAAMDNRYSAPVDEREKVYRVKALRADRYERRAWVGWVKVLLAAAICLMLWVMG